MSRSCPNAQRSRRAFAHSLAARPVTHAVVLALVIVGLGLSPRPAGAADPISKTLGETLYVPAFSKIGLDTGRTQPLASNLIVHNVDPERTITLTAVTYHDDTGALVRTFLDAPLPLAPMASYDALVPIRERTGGIGANFIVVWTADAAAQSPLVEAVMIGGTGTHGISFSSRARVIARTPAESNHRP